MPAGDMPAGARGQAFQYPAGELITSSLSNKGNPTAFGQDNTFRMLEQNEVRIIDNKGNLLFSGTGPEAARQAVAIGENLSETLGNKAGWTIQTGERTINPDGSVGPTRYYDVANEKVNKSALSQIANVAGTVLPLAMIPLTMGASAPLAGLGAAGNVALGAGVGAASAGLRGQDILKGAVMGGLTSAGGQFLSTPLKSAGLSADVARAVGTGIGTTAGGVVTGQPLDAALMSGLVSGGTTYLGSKLLGPSPEEIEFQRDLNKLNKNLMGDIEAFNIDAGDAFINRPLAMAEGFNPIDFKPPSLIGSSASSNVGVPSAVSAQAPLSLASTATPSSDIVVTGTGARPSFTSATPSFAVNVPGVTDLSEPEIKVTAQREAPPVEQPAFAVNIPADIAAIAGPSAEEDIEITAQKQAPVAEEPSLAVNVPTPTEAVGGPDLEEDIEIMARDEGLAQAEQPSFAVNTLGPLPPEIIATAQKEAALTQEEPSLAVLPPATSTPEIIATAQTETPAVAEEPSFAVTPSITTPEIIATAQTETPAVKEEPSFAVTTPPITTPEIIATAQTEAPAVKEEPSFAVNVPTATPEIIATGQRETPAVKEEPSFAVTTPPISTPEIIATAQTEAPAAEDKSSFAVNVPTATPEIIATAQKEVPAAEDKSSFAVDTSGLLPPEIIATAQTEAAQQPKDNSLAVIPAATTGGEKITVTAPKDQAVVKDEAAVGGPYIPPKTDIVVTGDKGTPKFDDKGEYTGPLVNIPSLVDDAVQEELAGKKTEPKKKMDVADYLKLAGLAVGLGAKLFDGNGSNGSAGKYSSTGRLSSIFTDKLPTPGQGGAFTVGGLGGTAADRTFAARPVTDWYRYGMGPAMDIPAGADLSRATSPYAGYGPGTLGEETFKAVSGMAHGGSMGYSRGSSRESFAVNGPGTGRSDDIPAVLSDGEYVIDAETVALLGDGSSKAGAKKLDEMRVKIRKAKGKNLAKGKFSVNAKRPEAYMSGGRI